MKCKDARKRTYVSEYPEIVSNELREAREHIRECAQCREFIEGERAFGSLLRNSIGNDKTPRELKNRVLAMKDRKTLKGVYLRIAVVASLLFLVIAGYMLMPHGDGAPVIRQIVYDHIQFLPSPNIQISASDPEQIETWFRGKVDFSVRIPQLSASLKGGRLCFLDGKRLALVFYEYGGSQLSLFMTTELNPEKLLSGEEVIIKGKKVHIVEQRGYNLLLWQDRGITYALVSDLSIDELKKTI